MFCWRMWYLKAETAKLNRWSVKVSFFFFFFFFLLVQVTAVIEESALTSFLVPAVFEFPECTNVALNANRLMLNPGGLIYMQISLMCCLQSWGRCYLVIRGARCSRPRWLRREWGENILSASRELRGFGERERERRLSQSISLQFNMIDPGRKSLSCSCMDGEGESAVHQSARGMQIAHAC